MKLTSEEIEVVMTQHREGEGKNGSYCFDSLIFNLNNGLQESIIIPQNFDYQFKKGEKLKLECELGYKGKIEMKGIINK